LPGGTTILATGPGAQGIVINGPNTVLTATGLTVTTQGGIDPSDNYSAVAASNFGGSMSLTNPTILTLGQNATGVVTAQGGQTTISGGSVTASGDGATAISVDGTGSILQATGVAVTTNGAANPSTPLYVNGLSVSNGGAATFSGGSITANGASNIALSLYSTGAGATVNLPGGTTIVTTGPGATGVNLNGPGTSLTATGLVVTTQGGIDPSDGFAARASTTTAARST
jgi:hypothetical protein